MIGVAIAGGLVCAFAAGYCLGYVLHKKPETRWDVGRGNAPSDGYRGPMGICDPIHPLHEKLRDARGRYTQ